MAKRVKIPGRLESAETGNIVTGADAVMDDEKGKTQVVINSEVDAAIINLAQGKQNVLTFDNAPTEDSPNPVTSAGVYTADKVLSDAIEAILLLIPSAASALNKLVDMQTMNSSIATATASFKGTYNLVSDLHLEVDATHEQIGAALDALSLGADNNDYAFVQVPNSATAPTEISKTERYKFNGTNWLFEYDLNNSGFTQGQWNAINSGVTSLLVGKLSDLPTNAELTALLAGKQDNLTFDNMPTAGSPNPVKSGGVYARNNEIVALINALDAAKQDVLTFDNAPVEGSPNPVKSGGVYTAISAVQAAIVALDAEKQNVLTFDSTPTLGSANPVMSSGIKTELNRIDGNITTLNDLYEALTQSALVIVQPADTWPVASPVTKTIYRVVDRVNTPPQNYSDYMWNGTVMVLMATYDNAIDDVPTPGSDNLVKSGGVYSANQTIYKDVSEKKYNIFRGNTLVFGTDVIPFDIADGNIEIVLNNPDEAGWVTIELIGETTYRILNGYQLQHGETKTISATLVARFSGFKVYNPNNKSIDIYIKAKNSLYVDMSEIDYNVFRGNSLLVGTDYVPFHIFDDNIIATFKNDSSNAGFFTVELIGETNYRLLNGYLLQAGEIKTVTATLDKEYTGFKLTSPNDISCNLCIKSHKNTQEKVTVIEPKVNKLYDNIDIADTHTVQGTYAEASAYNLNILELSGIPEWWIYYRIRTSDNSKIGHVDLMANNMVDGQIVTNNRKSNCPLDTWLSVYKFDTEVSMFAYIETLGSVTVYIDYCLKPLGIVQKNYPKNLVIVDAKGNGDYLNIDDALGDVKDSANNPVTILVMPGTYTSVMRTHTVRPYNPDNRYISIIGMDKNNCIYRNAVGYYSPGTEDTDGQLWDDAVLRVNGNVTIENMTILSVDDGYDAFMQEHPTFGDSHRTAYCVHFDGNCPENSYRTLRNCRLISNHACAVGCGTRKNNTIEMIDCEIESTFKANTAEGGGVLDGYGPIFVHSYYTESQEIYEGQRLSVKRCVVKNHNKSVGIKVHSFTPNVVNCEFINNVVITPDLSEAAALSGGTTLENTCFGNNIDSLNYQG